MNNKCGSLCIRVIAFKDLNLSERHKVFFIINLNNDVNQYFSCTTQTPLRSQKETIKPADAKCQKTSVMQAAQWATHSQTPL